MGATTNFRKKYAYKLCSVPKNPFSGADCEVAYHWHYANESTARELEREGLKIGLSFFKSLRNLPERYDDDPHYDIILYK